jgi:DUF1365 family protein
MMFSWHSTPQLMRAKVFHKRTEPVVNAFTYHVYYFVLPMHRLEMLDSCGIARDRFGLCAFYHKDHGARDGSDSAVWAREVLRKFKLEAPEDSLVLFTMPRILGHVFNPVSFWFSVTPQGECKRVIAEVNNTFGETHSYVLAHADGRAIHADDVFASDKNFHVSPFLPVEGGYEFRFVLKESSIGITIDFINAEGRKQLLTTLSGSLTELTRSAKWKAFFAMPMVTLKVIALIHLQAFKLMGKRVRYLRKPAPPTHEVTPWRS